MPLSNRFARLGAWLRAKRAPEVQAVPEAKVHVVFLDGTMSSLAPSMETNVGRMWRLMQERPEVCVYYEPGIQWRGLKRSAEVMAGVGINRQIRRAYTFLAAQYRPGDKIFFVGYSRGAYGVRALAGLIDRIGLIRSEELYPDLVDEIYTLYRNAPDSPAARAFAARNCHPKVEIEAVGVFDTVRALGIRWPIVWRFAPKVHEFRSNVLGEAVRHGFHALAMDENRRAYHPQLWEVPQHRLGAVQQVWFRGTHADIGGQVGEVAEARGLSNIPLVWMLRQLEACGLPLPAHWDNRYPQDGNAPMHGNWVGFGKLFWARKRRVIGRDPSERLHESVTDARDVA